MHDARKATDMRDVLRDLAPYVKRRLLAADAVRERDIPAICALLSARYDNVKISTLRRGGHMLLRIRVRGKIFSDKREFAVICRTRHNEPDWIDRLEMLDAISED